ncbi:cell wall-active antibiotics response protein LiaF [Cohnella terricola]|nr:cell wall-active antibiotics response protein LiaF [Cohnella terricola]
MHSSTVHRLLWGLFITLIGVVFLLNQIGLITMDIGDLIRTYWPVFLIVFGLQGLVLQHGGGFCWNSVTVLVGCYFLGRNLGLLHWEISDFVRFIVPVAIILFGINLIFKGNRPSRRRRRHHHQPDEEWNSVHPSAPPEPPGPPPAPPELDEFERRNPIDLGKKTPPGPTDPYRDSYRNETTPPPRGDEYGGWKTSHQHREWWKSQDWSQSWKNNHSRFIGDVHLGNDYWELRPMSISHFIGDTTLDLTKAQISVGETRVYVSSFIGDVKVFVPNDLSVGLQVVSSSLIGDVKVLDQKRGGLFNQMTVETPFFGDADKRVVLIVSSFIGDVRVTKVG